MCNRLPEIKKTGDAGIFPVYYSLKPQPPLYTILCSHVASNSVLFAECGPLQILVFANEEMSSSERRMEGGIADETSMPPFKCECFGSAAEGQPPSWVHTGLTASTMNVKCHTKHENRRNLYYCSSSSHQKSVSAHDKSKHNKPSPSSPEPTSSLWLCT